MFIFIFRLLGKYYNIGENLATQEKKKKFEKDLFAKTHKVNHYKPCQIK